jgi:hypothetical protein
MGATTAESWAALTGRPMADQLAAPLGDEKEPWWAAPWVDPRVDMWVQWWGGQQLTDSLAVMLLQDCWKPLWRLMMVSSRAARSNCTMR